MTRHAALTLVVLVLWGEPAVGQERERRPELAVLPVAGLLTEQCTSPMEEGGTGVVHGVVTPGAFEESVVLRGGAVELTWTMPGEDDGSQTATVPVGPGGVWRACRLPVGATVRAVAILPDLRAQPISEVREAVVAEGVPAELLLPLVGRGALELDGLTVAVARRVQQDLLDIGIRREALGRRFISTEDIEENRDGAMNAAHLVERQHLPGVGYMTDGDFDCVYMRRATGFNKNPRYVPTGMKIQYCAQAVLDGIPTHPSVLPTLKPSLVAAIAFLSPIEAGARFGNTEGGILYIWTHGGRE